MKKIFSLLIALAMLLSAAALAEDSTVYTLALVDPQIVVGEETMDLTNLEFDLSAAVTDYGPLSLILEAYAGEEYEYITGLFAQLDENGLGVYYNGMENMYIADLEQLTGMNVAELLSMLPLRTMLPEFSLEEIRPDAFSLTAEDRIAILESALGGFVYESLQQDDATVHYFSISREQTAAQITSIFQMLSSLSPELAELAEYDCALELGGSITAKGSPSEGDAEWTVVSEGTLFVSVDAQEVALPVTLTYTDDMNAFSLSFTMSNEGSTFSIALNGTSDVLSDGRSSTDCTLTLDVGGEEISLRYAALPEEGTARVDTLIEMSVPGEDAYLALDVITDFDPDSTYSFYTALTVDDGAGESVVDLYYAGDPVDDPEAGLDTIGWAEITLTSPDMDSVAFKASICTYRQDMDTEDWLLDSSSAIDVTTMADEDMEAASTDAMNVFQTDLSSIMEKVPALAEMFD